jgi:hypothetical protein
VVAAADHRPGNGLIIGGSLLLAWVFASYPLQSVQQATLMDALNSRDEKTFAVVERCVSTVNNWYRLPLAAISVSLIAVGIARRVKRSSDND